MQPEHELSILKRRLAVLTKAAVKNETILRRTREREMSLLEVESLDALLRLLVSGLVESYGLEAVTLFICDPLHEIRHLLLHDGISPDRLTGVQFVDELVGIAPQFEHYIRPWLGPFTVCDHARLFPQTEVALASVALIPLMRHKALIGSLNFGSLDRTRFTPYHAADFLDHIGTIASFSLENTINRAKLIHSGLTDVLTGWHNRRYLQDRLCGELARAQRNQQPLTCLLLDIDHFKRVNDAHGHLVGDAVLRKIAQRVEVQVRASDVAARFGGEEFTVLLPNTKTSEALDMAERIRQSVARTPIRVGDACSLYMTLSIGIASLIPDREEADLNSLGEGLLTQADVALYRAKSAGRNCVQLSV